MKVIHLALKDVPYDSVVCRVIMVQIYCGRFGEGIQTIDNLILQSGVDY